MKGAMEHIRKTYGVPAKRGMGVRVFPFSRRPDYYETCVIVSAKADRLMLRREWLGGAIVEPHHPTWRLQYMSDDGTTVLFDTREESASM